MGEIIEEYELRNKLFVFRNRKHAGKVLAEMLSKYNIKNAIVLAIPSGGVPIGYEISKALKIPFGLAIVKKFLFLTILKLDMVLSHGMER